MKTRTIFICVSAIMLLITASVQAEDQANKANTWVVTVEAGQNPAFEAALKTHMAFRSEHGDVRSWEIYTPLTGDELNTYIIRACCHTWADMDAYDQWSRDNATLANWMANVDQHVSDYAHHISTIDFDSSNWPEDMGPAKYVGVTYFYVKPGHSAPFDASIKSLSKIAKDGGWDRHWVWGTAVTGASQVYLATPYASYAGMAPPETSFAEFLAVQMDSPEAAQQALGEFSSHHDGSDYKIYAYRPDLSMSESN